MLLGSTSFFIIFFHIHPINVSFTTLKKWLILSCVYQLVHVLLAHCSIESLNLRVYALSLSKTNIQMTLGNSSILVYLDNFNDASRA